MKPAKRSRKIHPRQGELLRTRGTLPEQITCDDLAALNRGLGLLFTDLRSALISYNEGDQNGRVGVLAACQGMWRFVMLFKNPLSEGLHLPIFMLADALVALDEGDTQPLLKARARKGSRPADLAHLAIVGAATATVLRLGQKGTETEKARELVAETLNKRGVRKKKGKGEITGTTLRHWHDEVASDVERSTGAAMVQDEMLKGPRQQKFSALTQEKEAQKFALKALDDFVQKVRPGTIKKPS